MLVTIAVGTEVLVDSEVSEVEPSVLSFCTEVVVEVLEVIEGIEVFTGIFEEVVSKVGEVITLWLL